jgi:hypothetical protein
MTDNDDDELALPERYIERAGETLAYRLMEYLEFLGEIGRASCRERVLHTV